MVFTSPTFLFLFLPIVLLGYYAARGRGRNRWLLLASFLFYTWGSGALVLLLVVSTIADFTLGRIAGRAHAAGDQRLKRRAMAGSALVNLSLLGHFKYANFAVDQLNSLGDTLGIGSIAWTSVTLPIGISFYTFQTMSYTIDVARGRVEPLERILDFALYVSLFPQLVAGPIVRFHEVANQIVRRDHGIDRFAQGTTRFMVGLSKKVIVADTVAQIADNAFATDAASLSMTAAWVGLIAYSIQIYFDFSGYSDMAIGLGMMLGFTFPENFRRPYSAISVTDFWRRWHITLSNWFRDYLYIPLGGSRISVSRVYANLVIVFLVTGLWHGANWTFIAWGAYHGLLLLLERATGQRPTDPSATSWVPVRRMVTLFLAVLGWVWFRATDIGHALDYFVALAGLAPDAGTSDPLTRVDGRTTLTLFLACTTVLLPGWWVTGVESVKLATHRTFVRVAGATSIATSFAYAMLLVVAGTFSPFLYFQF